jgi:hypothetical protein
MKKVLIFPFAIIALVLALSISCKKEATQEPCDGKGTINVENKLDSTISVKIVETRTTKEILKDYTVPFVLTGNQPYTLSISGPQYSRDTTIMVLSCDNKLLIVIK